MCIYNFHISYLLEFHFFFIMILEGNIYISIIYSYEIYIYIYAMTPVISLKIDFYSSLNIKFQSENVY